MASAIICFYAMRFLVAGGCFIEAFAYWLGVSRERLFTRHAFVFAYLWLDDVFPFDAFDDF